MQSGLAADGRHAGARLGPGDDESPDVRETVPLGRIGGDCGKLSIGAVPAGLSRGSGRARCPRERGFPAALLGEWPPAGGLGRLPGQLAGPGTLAAGRAAVADGGLEQQTGRERSRAELTGRRSLQRLAALEPECLAVLLLGPAVRGKVSRDRPERPAAQVAHHQRAVDDDFAGRRIARRTVSEQPGNWTQHPV